MIVVDAGAFLEVLLASSGGERVTTLLETQEGAAPHLLDAEVFHRLVRLEKAGTLTNVEVSTALDHLVNAPILRFDHAPLFSTARAFATALSGHDALYAALATALDAVLVTTDSRLARTASDQLGIAVTTVPSSGRTA